MSKQPKVNPTIVLVHGAFADRFRAPASAQAIIDVDGC
jgi:hypothetical protein